MYFFAIPDRPDPMYGIYIVLALSHVFSQCWIVENSFMRLLCIGHVECFEIIVVGARGIYGHRAGYVMFRMGKSTMLGC